MSHEEEQWHETLQQLRIQLRRGMDGETSTQQRQLGLNYYINFGVNLLRLKDLAKSLPHDEELADLMWSKDVREMKILSIMIRSVEKLSLEKALKLIEGVDTLELAEQLVFRLFRSVPYRIALLEALFEERLLATSHAAAIPYLLLSHVASDSDLTASVFDKLSPMIIQDFTASDFIHPMVIYNSLLRIAYDRTDIDITSIVSEVATYGNETSKAYAKDILNLIQEK